MRRPIFDPDYCCEIAVPLASGLAGIYGFLDFATTLVARECYESRGVH
jgi:hypothetical protein